MDFILDRSAIGHQFVSEYQLKFLMIRLNQIHEVLLDRLIKKDFVEKSNKESFVSALDVIMTE
jgi:hypothetical protein